jgi:hypothetical protein
VADVLALVEGVEQVAHHQALAEIVDWHCMLLLW